MKIKSLTLNSFRGVPLKQTFGFTDKKDNPVSTIIFGDNGTGKSSIIDGLEFNLQGKIERSGEMKNEFRPSVLSHKNEDSHKAYTFCKFEDDSSSERFIKPIYDELSDNYKLEKSFIGAHPFFQVAPIALRRNDIITYSTTPVQKKQILFWKFIYQTEDSKPKEKETSLLDNVQIQNLEKERINLKKNRRKQQSSLANKLGIAVNEIPFSDRVDFETFIR